MKINTLACRLAIFVTVFALPGIAMAGSPTDWVQGTVVEVRSTAAVEDSGGELTPKQIEKVSRILGRRFSFHEMARLALGQHWKQLSAQEKKEFVHLFRNLLERSHLLSLSTHAGAEQRYVGERIGRNRAVVSALVKSDDGEVPVDYFLLPNNGTWKIYDLSIDGVRLSHTYRAEFNKVITKSSYKELVRKMSVKLEEIALEAESKR